MKKNGFSIVELLVGFSILVIAFTLWSGSLTQLFEVSNKGKDKFNLSMEQKAMVSLLEALSRHAATQALCVNASGDPIPHPYGRLNMDGSCDELKKASTTDIQNWEALSKKVSLWSSQNTEAELDKNYFEHTIKPAMDTAGCMNCHSGGYPKVYNVPDGFPNTLSAENMNDNNQDVAHRDFSSYKSLTEPLTYKVKGVDITSEPYANKAILTVKLGQTLLTKQMKFGKQLSSDSEIEHYVLFDKKTVSYSVANYEQVKKTVPGQCAGINAATACNTAGGEIYDPATCQEFCISFESPPICSCGKGCFQVCPGWTPKCLNWESQYVCLTKEKIETNTLYNIPGNLGSTAPYNPAAWENQPDQLCLEQLPSGKQCGGVICGAAVSDICMDTGTCRHFCTSMKYSVPVCTKAGCSPQIPIDCIEKKVEFQCHLAPSLSQTQKSVIYFSINSILMDKEGKPQTSATAVGAVR